MARARQVENAQAGVSEADAAVGEDAGVVRPPMAQRVGHRLHGAGIDRTAGEGQETADSTHRAPQTKKAEDRTRPFITTRRMQARRPALIRLLFPAFRPR